MSEYVLVLRAKHGPGSPRGLLHVAGCSKLSVAHPPYRYVEMDDPASDDELRPCSRCLLEDHRRWWDRLGGPKRRLVLLEPSAVPCPGGPAVDVDVLRMVAKCPECDFTFSTLMDE